MDATGSNTTSRQHQRELRQGLVAIFGSQTVLVVTGVLVAFLIYTKNARRTKYSKLPLPPGPPRLPFLGNVFNNPLQLRWIAQYLWGLTYGPVVYLNVFGKPTIVLTTIEAAHELLNKRASNYSGRALSVYAGDMVCRGHNIVFQQYDTRVRLHQRLNTPGLNPRATSFYQPVLHLESLQLLHDLISESQAKLQSLGEKSPTPSDVQPLDARPYFQRATGSSLNAVLFGQRILKGDPASEAKMEFLHNNPTAKALAKFTMIDIFPWLKHVPYAISPWKWSAEPMYQAEAAYHVDNLRKSLAQPGFNMAKHIFSSAERLNTGMSETEIGWVSGALWLANGETSPNNLYWFVALMINYPRVMAKAQRMLDDVVGRERLPTYEDKAQIPYIDAIINEVFRYRPVAPSGLDHAVAEEDEFMGYRIPKGSGVVISQWALTRDKSVFGADVDVFRPERWLEKDDLPIVAFGHGRRICPGRHFARETLWIMMSRLLWAFDMQAPIDPETNKRKMIDDMSMQPLGLVIGPTSYEAVFKPRGKWVEEVVEVDFSAADFDIGRTMEQIEAARVGL